MLGLNINIFETYDQSSFIYNYGHVGKTNAYSSV